MGNPIWVVKSVIPQKDYTLLLTFENNERRLYNALPLLEKDLYAPLKNIVFFMKATAAYGTVIWNDEIDIAPEALYENSTPINN